MYIYISSTKPLNYAEFATNFLFVIQRMSAVGGLISIPRYQLSLFNLFCVAVCEHHEYGFNEAKHNPLDDSYDDTNEKKYQLSATGETVIAGASELEAELRRIPRNREAEKNA
jgi:hypothetical protein